MLTTSFVTSKNQPLSWIFAKIIQQGNRIVIKYYTMVSSELIGQMLVNPKLTNQGRGYSKYGNTGVRIIPSQLEGTELTITFPVIEDTEIEELLYKKEGDREIDLVARIFPGVNIKSIMTYLNTLKITQKSFNKRSLT